MNSIDWPSTILRWGGGVRDAYGPDNGRNGRGDARLQAGWPCPGRPPDPAVKGYVSLSITADYLEEFKK